MTFGFSNVPGPKTNWVIEGYRSQGMGFIMPVGKSMVGSFSVISHADTVKMIISMDKAVMKSTQPMADILMNNLDEVLGGPEWRNYYKERGIKGTK